MDNINIPELFCIKQCAKWISSHNYSKVGLELPENLHHAPQVSRLIKEKIGFSPVVLESSNRACGNCCVDEVTARPRNIEAVIHFGRTCLTPLRALPVFYVLHPTISIDEAAVASRLLSEDGPKTDEDLILVYDILCSPFVDSLFCQLKRHFPHLIPSVFIVPDGSELVFHHESDSATREFAKLSLNDETGPNVAEFTSRKVSLPPDKLLNDYNFIYVGPNNRSFEPLQMRFSTQTFYSVDPTNNSYSVSSFTKKVMNRSRKIEQIKEAKTIGLLNSVTKSHQEISDRLKKLIVSSGKRYYSFFMGKINEAKLANIVGVDVFVYIGCPESTIFDRVEETYLYKKIVTPWELEVTLNSSAQWSMNFETNFRELLKTELEKSEEGSGREPISAEWKADSSALVPRNPGTVFPLHVDAAAQALAGLSWQGLDPQQEASVEVGTVIEGRRGIAMEYESEPKN